MTRNLDGGIAKGGTGKHIFAIDSIGRLPVNSSDPSERNELRRNNRLRAIRKVLATICLNDPERMISREDARARMIDIVGPRHIRTLDDYEEVMIQAQWFKETIDGKYLILNRIPDELGTEAVAPRSKVLIETKQPQP